MSPCMPQTTNKDFLFFLEEYVETKSHQSVWTWLQCTQDTDNRNDIWKAASGYVVMKVKWAEWALYNAVYSGALQQHFPFTLVFFFHFHFIYKFHSDASEPKWNLQHLHSPYNVSQSGTVYSGRSSTWVYATYLCSRGLKAYKIGCAILEQVYLLFTIYLCVISFNKQMELKKKRQSKQIQNFGTMCAHCSTT